jgi:hypothetical protein
MKSKNKQEVLRFPLSLLHYGNSYYIERIAALEAALAKKPRRLQIDMLGEGEVPADWALLIRSTLGQRSPRTRIVTNARSSLQNGSVLVWLLGDQRVVREDAWLFFRRASVSDDGDATEKTWKEGDLKYSDSDSEMDTEEIAHARVLQLISEYLPVKELAGKVIDVVTLRQFGLVDNDQLDRFLAKAFGQTHPADIKRTDVPKKIRHKGKVKNPVPAQK